MLSGSASFQMHPRNPFRNLLELFLEALFLASSCSQPFPSSSSSPSTSPSPTPPHFFHLSPLPPDDCQFFEPLLRSLSHRIHVTNLSGLWGGHYLFLSVREKQAQLCCCCCCFFHLFLFVGGSLLYNTVVVSAIH